MAMRMRDVIYINKERNPKKKNKTGEWVIVGLLVGRKEALEEAAACYL
jgi:hypothetical protein